MFKLKRWLALLLMGTAGGILMLSGTASAMNIQKVDTDKLLAKKADFELDQHAENDNFKVEVQLPDGLKKTVSSFDENADICRGVFKGHKVWRTIFSGSDKSNQLNRKAKIIATFPYIGTYRGQKVGAVETFSNFTSYDKAELWLCHNFYYGFWSGFHRGSEMDVNLKIIDEHGKPVSMDNSYLSVGSLNNAEQWSGAEYIGIKNYSQAFMVSDPTNCQQYKSLNGKLDVLGGNKKEGDYIYEWHDKIGGLYFERSTVAMHFNGNANLLFGQDRVGSWFAINSTPLQPYLDKPVKEVVDKKGSSADGKTVLVNQKEKWRINQTMPVKGTTCNSSFKTLAFVDKMDSRLKILKDEIYLWDNKGHSWKVSDVADVSIGSDNTVKASLKDSFCHNADIYDGRRLTLEIATRAKSDGSIENHAETVANGQSLTSNTVSVNVKNPVYPSPVKSASVSQVSFDGKEFTYDVKQQKHLIDTYI